LQSKGGGRSSAVKGVLQAARKGGELGNVGVLGRLGDLATIPEDYDVAVSTACGMLDHIVVQTTAGAQRCLEFLRKHGLGRANFIPLDKMKKGAHDRVVETPEGARRLFELIQPSNFAILPAIFLGVGDTLVAPDLETATRWAYEFGKRWRVVTLDGKLIETAGTMSGGGKSLRRGGMRLANARSKSTADSTADEEESMDCQKLQDEATKAQELLQQVRLRRKELTDEVRGLKKRVKALEVVLPKLAMEIEGCDTTRKNLTESIPGLRAQSELSQKDAAKLVDLTREVEKCKTDMASCSMLASKLETEVARLQKAILDAGGTKLKKQQAACEKALSALNDAEKALNSAKVAITTSEKAATKAEKNKAAAEEQLEKCKVLLGEKAAEFKALEEDAFHVMQAFEKVKEVEAEKREALEAVSKESEELRKSQSEVKFVEVDLVGQVDAFAKQITDAEKKIQHWSNEIEKLRAVANEDDDFDLSDDEEEEVSTKLKHDIVDEAEDVDMEDDSNVANADTERQPLEKIPKSSLPTLSEAALRQYDKDEIKEEITVLETERNAIAKNANMGAIAEYRKKEADYLARVTELDGVSEERNAVRKTHEELRRLRLEMFMDGFGQITLKLKEMYQMITLGGDAELELVDSLDPFSEGIVFSVRPPKKSWKNISNLSGGEKTLSSLALVFALHHYKPTPLYVMDEIDAALDFKNVSIVANYIKERTKNAQFIIISLRNNMFELADRLVGIYKTNNATKSVTINPRAFGVDAQQNGQIPTTPALSERTNAGGADRSASAVKDTSVRRRVPFEGSSEDVKISEA
jgi:structural maintenance of chromosome 4